MDYAQLYLAWNCIGARPRRLDKLRGKGIIISGYSEFPLQIKLKSEIGLNEALLKELRMLFDVRSLECLGCQVIRVT